MDDKVVEQQKDVNSTCYLSPLLAWQEMQLIFRVELDICSDMYNPSYINSMRQGKKKGGWTIRNSKEIHTQ